MDRRRSLLGVLALAACAKGTLDNTTTFGVSFTTTQSASSAEDSGDEADSGDTGGSTSEGGEADATTAPVTTAPITTDPASSDGGADSGPAEESSGGGPVTTMTTDPATDDGMPPPPDVGPWEACDLADCEAGNDCIELTGLRSNAPYCSPQCTEDADCPLPPDGDALPVCALSSDGAAVPTNCALLCEYDGLPYGTCPAGMVCTDVPDQMTPVSICMWP